jgi:hypothetical protein
MLSNIATNLLSSNPSLSEALDNSDQSSQYSAIKDKVTPRLCANIGRIEGVYIKRNELVWAIINAYNGETEDLVYTKAD